MPPRPQRSSQFVSFGDAMAEDTSTFFSGLTGVKVPRVKSSFCSSSHSDVPGETVSLAGDVSSSGRQTQDRVLWIELGLCKALVRGVSQIGFISPTPVQSLAIPAALTGSDVCARAVTGSGKTAAFLLPLLHTIITRPGRRQTQFGGKRRFIRAVVLLPTRELGMQCEYMLRQLLPCAKSEISVALAIGGVAQSAQEAALEAVPDIIIATPGRLVDLLHNYKGAHGSLDLSGVEIIVLDECDKMLTVTLRDQVVDILKRVPEETRQVLMFSATMTNDVDTFATEHLFEPKNVDVGHVALQSKLRQQFVRIRVGHSTSALPPNTKGQLNNEENAESEGKSKRIRSKRLREAAQAESAAAAEEEEEKLDEHVTKIKSRYLVAMCEHYFKEKTMIFTRFRTTAHRMHLLFSALGLPSAELQGNQLQSERFASLERFASGEAKYLFSTDVASRGLDIKGVTTVINVDLPPTLTAYIHRVGRTARIGSSGTALSLVDEAVDAEIMRKILAVSGVVNTHQASSVKRRDVPEEFLAEATARIDSVFPAVREMLAAEALEEKIHQAERRFAHNSNKITQQHQQQGKREKSQREETNVIADSVTAKPRRKWCLSRSERQRRDEEARRLYEKEAEITINRFQNELAGLEHEENTFLQKQKHTRRQERERRSQAKEKTKNLVKEQRRKSQQKVQAGVVKKMKQKKLRDARKAKRAEGREKNNKPSFKHRDGKKSMKKSRHSKRAKKH